MFSECRPGGLSENFLDSLGRVQSLRVIENKKVVWLFIKFISKFISILYNSENTAVCVKN